MESHQAGILGAIFGVTQVIQLILSLIVGGRMLWLSWSKKVLPELLLGSGFLLGSGLGFIVLVTGMVAFADPETPRAVALARIGVGYGLLDVSIILSIGFTYLVFKKGTTEGRTLFGIITLAVGSSYLGFGWFESFAPSSVIGPSWYWAHYGAMALGPGWSMFEALRYHGILRKRLALGLADPVVTNRFLLWGTASGCGLVIIGLGALPAAVLAFAPDRAVLVNDCCMIAMSLTSMVSMTTYWLTFFPTRRYLRRVRRGRDLEPASKR